MPQTKDDIIDISRWETKQIHPEGARTKNLYTSPPDISSRFPFIKDNYRYLFKQSSNRHRHQFWMEIIAYQIGKQLNIDICPVYVAVNSEEGISGSLTEWGYESDDIFVHGYRFLNRFTDGYDIMKGRHHNFFHISKLFFIPEIKEKIIEMLLFDCLIANTDRHHFNWGVITTANRLCPLFDHGTSLGYDILESKMDCFNFEAYNNKGYHHMKWKLNEDNVSKVGGEKHFKMIELLKEKFPDILSNKLKNILSLDLSSLENVLLPLVDFAVGPEYNLTEKRIAFTLKILEKRIEKLSEYYEQ